MYYTSCTLCSAFRNRRILALRWLGTARAHYVPLWLAALEVEKLGRWCEWQVPMGMKMRGRDGREKRRRERMVWMRQGVDERKC